MLSSFQRLGQMYVLIVVVVAAATRGHTSHVVVLCRTAVHLTGRLGLDGRCGGSLLVSPSIPIVYPEMFNPANFYV